MSHEAADPDAAGEEGRDAVLDGTIDPAPLISHRLSLDAAPRGYELFARHEATKVLLRP